jgi:hypothetical protein
MRGEVEMKNRILQRKEEKRSVQSENWECDRGNLKYLSLLGSDAVNFNKIVSTFLNKYLPPSSK